MTACLSAVAKNEIRQQLRRKAVIFSFFLPPVFSIFAALSQSHDAPQHTLASCAATALYLGEFLFVVTILFCADRLTSDSFHYDEITAASVLRRTSYYGGKLIANIFLYGIAGFVAFLPGTLICIIKLHIAMTTRFFAYFFDYYALDVLLPVALSIILTAGLTAILRNEIVSAAVALCYLVLPQMGNKTLMLKVIHPYATGSYYAFLTQTVLVPERFANFGTMQPGLAQGSAVQTGLVGFFAVLATLLLVLIAGALVFRAKPNISRKLNSN